MIGDYMVLTGGFDEGFSQTTDLTYTLDLADPDAGWLQQDSYPISPGITHGATVVVDSKFYICGGYLGEFYSPDVYLHHTSWTTFYLYSTRNDPILLFLGGHPGPHIPNCFVFDVSALPGTASQWSPLPDMPDGRGGGGLTFDATTHSITYAGGAERPNAGKWWYFTAIETIDYRDTWTLYLDDVDSGWHVEPEFPVRMIIYRANNVYFSEV